MIAITCSADRNITLFPGHLRVMSRDGGAPRPFTTNKAVTCVIKTNPGEHFSVMAMIPTMISLDEYEKLTRQGRDLAPGVASPAGHDRKKGSHGS